MPEKLVIQRKRPDAVRYRDMKLDEKTHDRIRAMSKKAKVSMVDIVRQMVDFCEDKIETE